MMTFRSHYSYFLTKAMHGYYSFVILLYFVFKQTIHAFVQGFWLETRGCSNSYILPARSLYILWGHDDRYWRMHSHPLSRFDIEKLMA